jgi:hypothetical protein
MQISVAGLTSHEEQQEGFILLLCFWKPAQSKYQ